MEHWLCLVLCSHDFIVLKGARVFFYPEERTCCPSPRRQHSQGAIRECLPPAGPKDDYLIAIKGRMTVSAPWSHEWQHWRLMVASHRASVDTSIAWHWEARLGRLEGAAP